MPNKFVQLMASPHPEKTINIQANLMVKTEAADEPTGNVSKELDPLPDNQYVCMQGQGKRIWTYQLMIIELQHNYSIHLRV